MKALTLIKDKHLEYSEVPLPEKPSDDSLLVRIKSSGICGSDIHRGFEGGAYHYPLVMGHEFAGVIEEAFPEAQYQSGDRVTVFPLLPCQKCPPCGGGDYAQCRDYDYFGSRRDGGFAEYLYVPQANIFPLPEHVDMIHAAMTEPCTVAWHGVSRLDLQGGEKAAVYGGGPIGNIAAQALRIAGCGKVIVIDIDEKKLEIAREMGFEIVNSREANPVEAVKELTGGGADAVVEACGLPQTFLQTVNSCTFHGQAVFLGNINGEFRIGEKDFSDILRKELRILGTWNSKVTPRGEDDWTMVLEHLDRDLEVSPLISHTPQLSEGVEIFNRLLSKKEYFSKVIFRL